MILPIKFEADWALIEQQKQLSIDKSNERENKTRREHEYQVGDKILLAKPGKLRKLTQPYEGPYDVTRVFTNGTISVRKGVVIQ